MRNHDHRFSCYEVGEGNFCYGDPITAAVIGAAGSLGSAALGAKGAKEQAKSIEKANEQNRPQYYGPGTAYAGGILSDAQRAYQANQWDPIVNKLQLMGRANELGYAEGLLPQMLGEAHESWRRGLDPGLDPYVGMMIQAAQNDLVQDYQRNIMPQIAQTAQRTGGYGGSRQGVAEGIASEGLLEGLGDVSTRLLSDAYGKSLNQQRAAWNAMNNMLGAGFLPSKTQQAVGELYRQDYAQPTRNLVPYNALAGGWSTGSQGFEANPTPSVTGGALQGFGVGGGGDWLKSLLQPNTSDTSAGNPNALANAHAQGSFSSNSGSPFGSTGQNSFGWW